MPFLHHFMVIFSIHYLILKDKLRQKYATIRVRLTSRAGRYGQNLYQNIFLNFGRFEKLPRMLRKHDCSHKPHIIPPPVQLYHVLDIKMFKINKSMGTFYLNSLRNMTLPNKHLGIVKMMHIKYLSCV